MSLNSHWFQKYEPSKLNDQKKVLLVLKWTILLIVEFDGSYFWNQWEFRDILYLILKVQSSFIWSH